MVSMAEVNYQSSHIIYSLTKTTINTFIHFHLQPIDCFLQLVVVVTQAGPSLEPVPLFIVSPNCSRSEKDVGPVCDVILRLPKGASLVALASPLDVVIIVATLRLLHCRLSPWGGLL